MGIEDLQTGSRLRVSGRENDLQGAAHLTPVGLRSLIDDLLEPVVLRKRDGWAVPLVGLGGRQVEQPRAASPKSDPYRLFGRRPVESLAHRVMLSCIRKRLTSGFP